MATLNDVVKGLNNIETLLSGVSSSVHGISNHTASGNTASGKNSSVAFSNIKSSFNQLKGIADDLTRSWRKLDQASANFAKSVGISNRGLVALRKNTISMVKNGGIGINYGIGMEELLELQQNYSQAIGRNVGLTANDIETSAAMSRLMGGKGGEFAAALENFGLSYTEAGNRVGKMFKTASKYGLSFEKYSQNFLTNIKLAQNYTFKDGLRGLERMAQKSTAIKLDMQQIASFADKVSTLQGAVETSAALQVLGGPFAQFSDPLGMLNEGLTDMESLFDRFQKMTQNLGKFNAQKGQVDVSVFNKQRLREAAKAMGMDYNQVMESIQAQGRREFIKDNIKGNFTDEEKEFLMNTATISGGTAKMTYINDKGQRVEKDVNSMNSEDIKQARAQSQSDSDNIKDIAKSTRSFDEKVEGIGKTIEAMKAGWVEGSMNWINNKLNSVENYLKLIEIGVAALTIGKGIGAFSFGSPKALKKLGEGNIFKGWMKSGGAAFGGIASAGIALGSAFEGYNKVKDVTKKRDDLVGSGKVKKGGKEDAELTRQRQGEKGAAWGKTIGNIVGGLGSLIPVVGAIAGPALSIAGGMVGEKIGRYFGEKRANKEIEKRHKESIIEEGLRKKIEENSGYKLGGGYTKEEYNKIISAINNGGDNTITKAEFEELPEALRKKMQESGDVSLFGDLEEFVIDEANMEVQTVNINAKELKYDKNGNVVTKANGGLLNGPSHRNGGMPILGSNIQVEGGEFVVNKHAAKRNLGLLTSINQMGDGGIIAPREDSNIKPIKVIPVGNTFIGGVNKTSVEPINININGTIKLDGGNGKTIDMNALLKDPVFIRNITSLIEQQMIYDTKGTRYTDRLVK